MYTFRLIHLFWVTTIIALHALVLKENHTSVLILYRAAALYPPSV